MVKILKVLLIFLGTLQACSNANAFTYSPAPGKTPDLSRINNSADMIKLLNSVATKVKKDIWIVSGYRNQGSQNAILKSRGCAVGQNKTCRGTAGTSTHTVSLAADVKIEGYSGIGVHGELVQARARFRLDGPEGWRVLKYCSTGHSHIDNGQGKEGTNRTPEQCFKTK